MRTRVQKWGNSLAIRIPRSYAIESKLEDGTAVDLAVEKGAIVVKPANTNEYTLEGLLAGVNRKNVHKETRTGRRVGKEIW
jgi:antitoxin MazE